jgi:hypothetical protein
MLETYAGKWLELAAPYFTAPLALAKGDVSALTVVATAGMLLFVIGVVLAIAWRVRRARWLVVPTLLTLLAPLAIIFVEATLGWLGRLTASIFGVLVAFIWVGVVAGRLPRQLPIWLVGAGLVSFIGYFGLVTLLPLLLT